MNKKDKLCTSCDCTEPYKFYRCTAYLGKYRYITTNDKDYAEKLISNGGKIISHPSFFNQSCDCSHHLAQSIPFVLQILQENQDLNQKTPIDKHESFLGQMY